VDVAGKRLAPAIHGRERLLENRLVPFSMPDGPPTAGNRHIPWGSVAIVGRGYVGLPTALALLGRSSRIIGFDISDDRLHAIESGDVDLSDLDRLRLAAANADESFQLTSDSAALANSDAVTRSRASRRALARRATQPPARKALT
jgi:UDP-N-acetyl-D-glucosamine dehydrogenase